MTDKPCIALGTVEPRPTVGEYLIISPCENPWLSKLIVLNEVDIPAGLTLNFRCWYPEPPFTILTSNNVFLDSVLNLWIPLDLVSVAIPMVLIPALPVKASDWLLNILIVLGFTTLTKYGSPSANVPINIVPNAEPMPSDALPWFL